MSRPITLRLTHNGVTDTIKGWAVRTGISYNTLKMRMKYGWTTERILSKPLPRKGNGSGKYEKDELAGAIIILPGPKDKRLYVGICRKCCTGAAYWPSLNCDDCLESK